MSVNSRFNFTAFLSPTTLELSEAMRVVLQVNVKEKLAWPDFGEEIEISNHSKCFLLGFGDLSIDTCRSRVSSVVSFMEMGLIIPFEERGILNLAAFVYGATREAMRITQTNEVVIFADIDLVTTLDESSPESEVLLQNEMRDAMIESEQMQDQMGFGAIPAKADAIEALENVVYEERGLEDSCTICLEEFVVEELLKRMSCVHVFHQGCIDQWLRRSNACPICRFKLQDQDTIMSSSSSS